MEVPGGPWKVPGGQGVSWGAGAGLVGSFGGALEAPFSVFWEVNLHTV